MDYARIKVETEMARNQSKGRRQKQKNPATRALWLPLTRRDFNGSVAEGEKSCFQSPLAAFDQERFQ